jgi:hypothetical protein
MLDKAKAHTENLKGLKLVAVIYTTAQVSRLVEHTLLYRGGTERSSVNIVYALLNCKTLET